MTILEHARQRIVFAMDEVCKARAALEHAWSELLVARHELDAIIRKERSPSDESGYAGVGE